MNLKSESGKPIVFRNEKSAAKSTVSALQANILLVGRDSYSFYCIVVPVC